MSAQGSLLLVRLARLPLRTLRAVEDDLRRIIVGEVGDPAALVARKPHPAAPGALWDERNGFRSHCDRVALPSIVCGPLSPRPTWIRRGFACSATGSSSVNTPFS